MLERLLELKKKLKTLWETHAWTSLYMSDEEKELDNKLKEEIYDIEKDGVFCRCLHCGVKEPSVSYKAESDDLLCDECADKLRDIIRDKHNL